MYVYANATIYGKEIYLQFPPKVFYVNGKQICVKTKATKEKKNGFHSSCSPQQLLLALRHSTKEVEVWKRAQKRMKEIATDRMAHNQHCCCVGSYKQKFQKISLIKL